MKSPLTVLQVLPSPPHTRHLSSLADEPKIRGTAHCLLKVPLQDPCQTAPPSTGHAITTSSARLIGGKLTPPPHVLEQAEGTDHSPQGPLSQSSPNCLLFRVTDSSQTTSPSSSLLLMGILRWWWWR
ncbi:hypothetical protein E2C01_011817 [Portunus trituberculatus]|uniref:Uncharacterized protein n=1 Tax=Portunus trituberculatus TaxID=210409 RepID=A0A5B7DC37_PORTR|nr:hypothetical protein [Portunus trituberculatus]